MLGQAALQLDELETHIDFFDEEIKRFSREHEACQRMQTILGFGVIISSVFFAQLGTGEAYRRGRDVSASLGLVPRQYSSGSKEVLLGISKWGGCYLRGLLIHGARAVVRHAYGKGGRLSRWIQRPVERRGHNKAVVALANKMARMGWAILAHKIMYGAV